MSAITIYVSSADEEYAEMLIAIAGFYKSKGMVKKNRSTLIMDAVKPRVAKEIEYIKKVWGVDIRKIFYEWKAGRGETLSEFFSKKTRGGVDYNKKLEEYFENLGKSLKNDR